MESSISLNSGSISANKVNDNIRVLESNINSTIGLFNNYSNILENYKDTLLSDAMNRLQYINRIVDSISANSGNNSLVKRYLFDTTQGVSTDDGMEVDIKNNKLVSSSTNVDVISSTKEIEEIPVAESEYIADYSTEIVIDMTDAAPTFNTLSFTNSSLFPFYITSIKDAGDTELDFIDKNKYLYGRCEIVFPAAITTNQLKLTIHTKYAKATNQDPAILTFFEISQLPVVSIGTSLFSSYIYTFKLTDIVVSHKTYKDISRFNLEPFDFETLYFTVDDNGNTEYTAEIKFLDSLNDPMEDDVYNEKVAILPLREDKLITEYCNYDADNTKVKLRFIPDPSSSIEIYEGDDPSLKFEVTDSGNELLGKDIVDYTTLLSTALGSYNSAYVVKYTPLLSTSGSVLPTGSDSNVSLKEEIDKGIRIEDPGDPQKEVIKFTTKYPVGSFTIVKERDGEPTNSGIDYVANPPTVTGRKILLPYSDIVLNGIDVYIEYTSPYLNIIDSDDLIVYNDKGGVFINKNSSKINYVNKARVTIAGTNRRVGYTLYPSVDDLIIYYSE